VGKFAGCAVKGRAVPKKGRGVLGKCFLVLFRVAQFMGFAVPELRCSQ